MNDNFFNIELNDFEIDFDNNLAIDNNNNQFIEKDTFIRPQKAKKLKDQYIRFKNALDLVKEIDIKNNDFITCYVNGLFIFGDFIEAFINYNNFKIKELTLSTLSMNYNNVDSLKNIMKTGNVQSLNILLSDYFFSHYRTTIVKYLYDSLKEFNIDIGVCRTHTKVVLFETLQGNKCSISGSANLRSSNNFEVFYININESLYNFHYDIHKELINKFNLNFKENG